MNQILITQPFNITGGVANDTQNFDIQIPLGYRYVSHSHFLDLEGTSIEFIQPYTMDQSVSSLNQEFPPVQNVTGRLKLDGSGAFSGILWLVVEEGEAMSYSIAYPEIN